MPREFTWGNPYAGFPQTPSPGFFSEWKQLRKENEHLKARLAELEAKSFSPHVTGEVEGHTRSRSR